MSMNIPENTIAWREFSDDKNRIDEGESRKPYPNNYFFIILCGDKVQDPEQMTVTWGRLMLKPRCCMTIPEGPGNERTHVEEVRAHHPNVLILFEHLTKVEPEHESVAQSWVKLLRDGWTLDVPTRTLHPPPNPPQPVKCSCGYIATKGFQFCPKCGLQLDAEAEPVEPAPEPVVIPDTPTKAPKAPKAPKLKKKKEA